MKVANSFSASQILSKNLLEKMSEILAEENYMYDIAVTTVRIEDKIKRFINLRIGTIPPISKQGVLKTYKSVMAYDVPLLRIWPDDL